MNIFAWKYTPLWPAGHLPHKGGDRLVATVSPNNRRYYSALRQFGGKSAPLVISPLVGEMAGKPEGGGLAEAGAISHDTMSPAP